ncbi:MAG: hypothetical protein OEM38_07010 [Gammaproteobacteria bacterium]|nr:hypothetical protein [Gammaproteobacteria bacterium]
MQIQGTLQKISMPENVRASLSSRSEAIDNTQASSSDKEISNPPKKTIDMHDISPREYSELVRAGLADIPVPIIFPGGRVHLDGKQAEMADVKTDYIAQSKNSIELKKSIGDTSGADFLLSRLSVVEELHGVKFLPKENSKGIDLTA